VTADYDKVYNQSQLAVQKDGGTPPKEWTHTPSTTRLGAGIHRSRAGHDAAQEVADLITGWGLGLHKQVAGGAAVCLGTGQEHAVAEADDEDDVRPHKAQALGVWSLCVFWCWQLLQGHKRPDAMHVDVPTVRRRLQLRQGCNVGRSHLAPTGAKLAGLAYVAVPAKSQVCWFARWAS